LLTLLRSSLYDISADFPADTDWHKVLKEANAQTVAALAAKALPKTLTPEQLQPWKNIQYSQIANYVRYLVAQDELCRLFAEKNIPMAILKGSAAAVFYPQPSLRRMGDIDFIVPEAMFDQAGEIMLAAGYQSNGKVGVRHAAYHKDGLEFEMHRRFSHPGVDIESYITEGLQHTERGAVNGHEFPMLPRLANGLILLEHMRSHLRVGLGLRQLIDWMMFVEHELDDTFWRDTFCDVAREKNLDTLAVTTTRLCQKHLGLSESITWCAGADDTLCDFLLENLLSSGNFGVKNRDGNAVQGVMINIRREGLFPYLQRVGERDWKLYHQHHWLRPFAWLYESFVFMNRYIKIRKRKKSVLTAAMSSTDRYDLLKKLNIN